MEENLYEFKLNFDLVKIGDKLYHEFNANFGLLGCLEEVRSESQYEYLVNQKYYDMVDGVRFAN